MTISARRELTTAVAVCAAAGALVSWVLSRSWATGVTARPGELPPLVRAVTGRSLVPTVGALAIVAFAGSLALIATRGGARRAVGAVLALAGAGWVAAALLLVVRPPRPLSGEVLRDHSVPYALLCVIAGALVAGVGVWTIARGTTWPVMGRRYAHPQRDHTSRAPDPDASPDREPHHSDEMWDALDRGEDPTNPDTLDAGGSNGHEGR